MNIFYDDERIIGKAEQAHLRNTLADLRQLAKGIKNKLGRQSYLLDKYLFDLLNAINQTSACDAAEQGAGYMGELIGLCCNLSRGADADKNHPLYGKVKVYISEHPLPYQEHNTRLNLYYVGLMDDFLGYAIPKFFEGRVDAIRRELDMVYLHGLYRDISSIIGGEDQMEELNLLIRQRFQVATAMQSFIQGITNTLLDSLTERDAETGKMVLQLWMDQLEE